MTTGVKWKSGEAYFQRAAPMVLQRYPRVRTDPFPSKIGAAIAAELSFSQAMINAVVNDIRTGRDIPTGPPTAELPRLTGQRSQVGAGKSESEPSGGRTERTTPTEPAPPSTRPGCRVVSSDEGTHCCADAARLQGDLTAVRNRLRQLVAIRMQLVEFLDGSVSNEVTAVEELVAELRASVKEQALRIARDTDQIALLKAAADEQRQSLERLQSELAGTQLLTRLYADAFGAMAPTVAEANEETLAELVQHVQAKDRRIEQLERSAAAYRREALTLLPELYWPEGDEFPLDALREYLAALKSRSPGSDLVRSEVCDSPPREQAQRGPQGAANGYQSPSLALQDLMPVLPRVDLTQEERMAAMRLAVGDFAPLAADPAARLEQLQLSGMLLGVTLAG